MSLRSSYESLLWRSIALAGADGSVERKMLAAVGLQFLGAVAMAAFALFTAGALQIVGVGATLALSVVAFFNTYLVAERDFVEPLVELETAADDIAAGEFQRADIPATDRDDEIAGLVASFQWMQANLATASRQADALARQDFEDTALDADVPGRFGESMATMADSLQSHTEQLEAKQAELERQSEQLERLVDALSAATDAARNGDLTALLDPDDLDVAAEHRAVVEDFNDLLRTLGDTIADIQSFSEDVLEVSAETESRVEEVAEHSAEVSASVDEIAAGANQQTNRLNDIAAEMDTVSATVEEIAASADDVAATAQAAADRGEDGRAEVEDTIEALRGLREQSQAVADTVEELAAEVDRIDGITELIDDIAEETNMLALNASIEAARTGEDGDGFAVVADEVKGLAEETREQAADISELVETVTQRAEDASTAIAEVDAEVERKIDRAEGVLRDFDAIVDEVANVNHSVQEISEATDEGAQSVTDAVGMVDEIASVSEETAAEADTVAASASEQTEATDEVADRMDDLAGRTEELAALLDEFDVPESAGGDRADEAEVGAEDRGRAGATATDGGQNTAFDWADE
ncbi:methyl-accepting chemotaxis protein [Halobacterium sp. NMX12-1]|uniref:Methyl-accepting chemotaxis protein n=1 Tax=Halobacterium sp. NMX12-1 TaxID=3166650 RepID=A0AAU8CHS3_9EURY